MGPLGDFDPAFEKLTERQRDILRQIAHGRSAAEVAADDGITVSTVETHLAAIRERLGVARTVQAVALFWQQRQRDDRRRHAQREEFAASSGAPYPVAACLSDLGACRSFDEAWQSLCAHLASIGFVHAFMGVIPEPFGDVSTHADILAASRPGHMEEYARLRNLPRNPIEQAMGKSREDIAFTPERLAALTRAQFPEELSREALAMLVPGQPLFLFPQLEPQSGAPFAIALQGEADHMRQLRADGGALSGHVRGITREFWHLAKGRGWLVHRAGLTPRQAEALNLAARGLDARQIAWRLGISDSSAVKRLQGARRSLGAPNIAAAIYRGTVYGALGHALH